MNIQVVIDVTAGTATRHQAVLAGSLIAIELVAGMQAYLTKTILPILAADLDAQEHYGVIAGSAQIATFVALPIGAHLARRYPLPRLLMLFTVGLSLGAALCAAAPTLETYLVGQAIRAFAGGCLASISISAVAVGLGPRARQITLALMQATWIVSSILGPVYAATTTHFLSWRWAMVLYLPVLVAGRWLVAAHLRQHRSSGGGGLPVGSALLLGAGLALSILPVPGAAKPILVIAGAVVMAVTATRVLPAGVFTLRSPRRRALALLFGLTGTYFGADAVIALTSHDRFGLDVARIAVVVMAGGLAWAVVGLACGLRPAVSETAFRRRASIGVGLIAASCAIMAGLVSGSGAPAVPVLGAVWAVAGAGIGLAYLDILNRLFTEPELPDGLDATTMAGAAVMAESIAAAITATLATTWLGTGFGLGATGARHAVVWGMLCLAAFACLVPLARTGQQRI